LSVAKPEALPLMAANAAIKLVYDLLIAAGDASVAPDRVT
jgi:hypothetical protein